MSRFLETLHSQLHNSWNEFLTDETISELNHIEKEIRENGSDTTPAPERVLHFMTNDLYNVKIVIIGQDPYPQKGVATGRAFEVSTLKSWNDTFRNVSLKNIIRAVYAAYNDEFLTYNIIKQKMKGDLFNDSFKILPPDKLFKSWELQGVLLLNTSFTCETGKPGSHARLWSNFTKELLTFINKKNSDLIWFLWGNHAKNITSHLKIKNAFTSNHPMICKHSDDDFLFGRINMFYETKDIINWKGI
ncbi:MAG: uracil-DNA glycosylase [Chlorobi bacterium]|nr:uracil-DNA glycosylase [Chlorobiota bacterium]